VLKDGYLYGFHGRQEYGQALRCIEFKTGKVQWTLDGFGAGTVTLVGDKLGVMRENGELQIADASPKALTATIKTQLLPGVVRSYPAIADGKIFVRNEKSLAGYSL
jgi:outer membrane protein assembly factor BamB